MRHLTEEEQSRSRFAASMANAVTTYSESELALVEILGIIVYSTARATGYDHESLASAVTNTVQQIATAVSQAEASGEIPKEEEGCDIAPRQVH